MKNVMINILLCCVCSFAIGNYVTKTMRVDRTYKTYDSTMVIHLYHGGGKYNSSENIYVRFDSCVRIDMSKGIEKTTKFAMTDNLRKRALEILKQTKITNIKSNKDIRLVNDKSTTRVCIELKKKNDFCISSSSSCEITNSTKANFNNLCSQLREFSMHNGIIAKSKFSP